MKGFAVLLSTLLMAPSIGAETTVPPHCFDEWADPVEIDKRQTDTPLEEFENLRPGMQREAVIERVGEPSFLCGSGLFYDVYVLPDQREIWVHYQAERTAWAIIVDAERKDQKPVFGVRTDDH